ncbi:MAG: hypothetical protein CMK59_00555 [Proteobacteria bacterium]|nr:hypothetical protein [Pseudomonadota bacterium]
MPLSDEEQQEIRAAFLKELKREHEQREARAQQKMRKTSRHLFDEDKKQKDILKYKSDLRREFYEEYGYEIGADHTGREKWLSPAESRRHKRRKNRTSKKNTQKGKERLEQSPFFYLSVILLAAVLGFFIAK